MSKKDTGPAGVESETAAPTMTPQTEREVYTGIVAAVKAEARAKPARTVGGAWVTWEIQRRWAKHNGRPFDKPEPAGPGGMGSTARAEPPVMPAGSPQPVDDERDDVPGVTTVTLPRAKT